MHKHQSRACNASRPRPPPVESSSSHSLSTQLNYCPVRSALLPTDNTNIIHYRQGNNNTRYCVWIAARPRHYCVALPQNAAVRLKPFPSRTPLPPPRLRSNPHSFTRQPPHASLLFYITHSMTSVINKRQQARNERALQELIRSVPGNDRCADCQTRNPGTLARDSPFIIIPYHSWLMFVISQDGPVGT